MLFVRRVDGAGVVPKASAHVGNSGGSGFVDRVTETAYVCFYHLVEDRPEAVATDFVENEASLIDERGCAVDGVPHVDELVALEVGWFVLV